MQNTYSPEAILKHKIDAALIKLKAGTITYTIERNLDYKSSLLGQFQSVVALRLGQVYNFKSTVIKDYAQKLASMIIHDDEEKSLAECFVTGIGYLNFIFHSEYLLQLSYKVTLQNYTPVSLQTSKILLDFGGMNVAKSLHLGHIRSLLIGESLRRLYKFFGYQVFSDVHLGDIGTHVGKVILGIKQYKFNMSNLPANSNAIAELSKIYSLISEASTSNPVLQTEASTIAKLCQLKTDKKLNELWAKIYQISLEYMKSITRLLDVHFDYWDGESAALPYIPTLLQHPVVQQDNGGLIIALDSTNLLVQKSDGGYLYATTELASIKKRIEEHHFDKIVYVVDYRQKQHFQQVFEAAKKLQLVQDTDLMFAGFGTINDSTGKPFSTRSGKALNLTQVIMNTAVKLVEDYGSSEVVALGNIKFSILANKRTASYKYLEANFQECKGKTGAYILYTLVRLNKVIKELGSQDNHLNKPDCTALVDVTENNLLITLLSFQQVAEQALFEHDPSNLAEQAYLLANQANNIYQATNIAQQPEPRKQQLLAIFHCVKVQLQLLADLLCLTVPETM